MGEEEKKPEEQKVEEKKAEEDKKEEVEAKPEDDQKDEKKTEESKEAAPAAQPPQEIILRVYMHCEGCARKVRRCLKGFEGVEDVETDCKTHNVVVKGEKADPRKVLARVQRKSHRQVELLSPMPPLPSPEDPKKPEEKEIPEPQGKKEEVITVVLKVHMHCEACAQEIKKRIQRMKGVESADPDLKGSQVTVKGVFEAPKLVEYVYKRTGKHAVIVKQEPENEAEPEKKEEDKGKEEKKGEEGGDKDEKKGEEAPAAAADGGGVGNEKKEGGGEEAVKPEADTAEQEEIKVVELKRNDFYYYYPPNYQIYPPSFATEMYSYPPRFATEMYSYPPAPQMFSDENPNACSVM